MAAINAEAESFKREANDPASSPVAKKPVRTIQTGKTCFGKCLLQRKLDQRTEKMLIDKQYEPQRPQYIFENGRSRKNVFTLSNV